MFKAKSPFLTVLLVLAILCICFGEAAPQKNNKGGKGKGSKLTPQQKAAQKEGGISTAKDGSATLDQTVEIK